MVLAKGLRAVGAAEQHPAGCRGLAPALVALVVRAHPAPEASLPRLRLALVKVQVARQAGGVVRGGAAVANDYVAAVPAQKAVGLVVVVSARQLERGLLRARAPLALLLCIEHRQPFAEFVIVDLEDLVRSDLQ